MRWFVKRNNINVGIYSSDSFLEAIGGEEVRLTDRVAASPDGPWRSAKSLQLDLLSANPRQSVLGDGDLKGPNSEADESNRTLPSFQEILSSDEAPKIGDSQPQSLLRVLIESIGQKPFIAIPAGICLLVFATRALTVLAGLFFGNPEEAMTTVRGELLVNGGPVMDGTIQFLPCGEGLPASAAIKNGSFEAERVPLGHCRVLCFAVRKTGIIVTEGGHSFPELINIIPEAFRNGIEVTVEKPAERLVLNWSDD